MKLRVVVTPEHISKGIRGEWACNRCPIDAKRRFASVDGRDVLLIGDPANEKIAALPQCAVDFVQAFDAGLPVQPQSFDLEFHDWKKEQ